MKNQPILSQQNKLIQRFNSVQSHRSATEQSAIASHRSTVQQTGVDQSAANSRVDDQIRATRFEMNTARRDLTQLPSRKADQLNKLFSSDNLLQPPINESASLAEAEDALKETVSLFSAYTRNFKLMCEEYAGWRQRLFTVAAIALVLSLIAIITFIRNWTVLRPYFISLVLLAVAIMIYQKREQIRASSAWQQIATKSTELWERYAPLDRIRQK